MTETMLGICLVILCTVIEGFAQLFLKKSSSVALSAGCSVSGRQSCTPLSKRAWVILGVLLLFLEALLYTGALQFLDISTAYPIGSLSFVAVTILSRIVLGEDIAPMRWFGVFLIIVGACLVVARA